MKPKQVLFCAGVIFQVIIVSVMFYFLHEVREKKEPIFEEEGILEEISISLEEKAKVPFVHYVIGSGKVSCSSYVKVNPRKEGVFEALFVEEGDVVHVGDPLFQVDDRMLRCFLQEKKAEYETALLELKLFEEATTESKLKADVLRAISREKEVGIASMEKMVSDCKVLSPIEGRVLKINVQAGEYGRLQEEAMVIGCETPLHLHVFIDEKEMWRISPTKNLRAIARHKTNSEIYFVLNFVAVKPLIDAAQGKMELVFALDKGKAPLYLDQTLDVYIESASKEETTYLDYQLNQIYKR